jgi:hypothetical protein
MEVIGVAKKRVRLFRVLELLTLQGRLPSFPSLPLSPYANQRRPHGPVRSPPLHPRPLSRRKIGPRDQGYAGWRGREGGREGGRGGGGRSAGAPSRAFPRRPTAYPSQSLAMPASCPCCPYHSQSELYSGPRLPLHLPPSLPPSLPSSLSPLPPPSSLLQSWPTCPLPHRCSPSTRPSPPPWPGP